MLLAARIARCMSECGDTFCVSQILNPIELMVVYRLVFGDSTDCLSETLQQRLFFICASFA